MQEGGTLTARRCVAQRIAATLHRVALTGLPDAPRQRADLDAIVAARITDGERCRTILPSVFAAFWCLLADRLRDDVVTAAPAGLGLAVISGASFVLAVEPADVGVNRWVWLVHGVSSAVFAWSLFDPQIDGNGRRFRIGASLHAAALVPLTYQIDPMSQWVWGLKASLVVLVGALALLGATGWRYLPDSTLLAGVFAALASAGVIGLISCSSSATFQLMAGVISVALASLLWSAPRIARTEAFRAVATEATGPATA